MNLNRNYYQILGVANTSTEKEIKKAYYKLSFVNHPDKGGDHKIFSEMTEAYDVLCGEERSDYDMKSKFGNNYNEYFELFDINIQVDYDTEKDRLEKFKKNEVLDIYIKIDDNNFDGSIEYERWVKCKGCDGTGKDLSSKIIIRDSNGNITKTFDADDGCDFCDGTGKDYTGNDCSFCFGKGKIGINICKKCNGERRILGKQKLSGVKIIGDETKIDAMGHFSRTEIGKVGYLLIRKIKS